MLLASCGVQAAFLRRASESIWSRVAGRKASSNVNDDTADLAEGKNVDIHGVSYVSRGN